MKFDKTVGPVNIKCQATDEDPKLMLWKSPAVKDCHCDIDDLPRTLKEVWAARSDVIARLKQGESPPISDGRWTCEMKRDILESEEDEPAR